jgi:hypothetical protein
MQEGEMKAKWKRDGEGDYSLALPSGATAWIAKSEASKNQKPWFGTAIGSGGNLIRISAWTLASAKAHAEKAMT